VSFCPRDTELGRTSRSRWDAAAGGPLAGA
jgi:hypothetical protein